MRWAPPTFAAIDKIREEKDKREAAKQRNREKAAEQSGPRFQGSW